MATRIRKPPIAVVDADPPAPAEPPVWQSLLDEVQQISMTLMGKGIDLRDTIDPRQIRPRIESYSACRILVLKGICTQDELQAEMLAAQRDLLRQILQVVEEQQLRQAQEALKPVVARKGDIVPLRD